VEEELGEGEGEGVGCGVIMNYDDGDDDDGVRGLKFDQKKNERSE